MLTFTPLSGAAKSSRASPLAYLLQVDDINILLDCGSPDWCPEPSSFVEDGGDETESSFHWRRYCDKLKEWVVTHKSSDLALTSSCSYRIAPSVDLVLLSHGDPAHSGLYPYAYSRWGLKAPTYSTLAVQAMARIAATEEAEGIRDEEHLGNSEEQATPSIRDGESLQGASNASQESYSELGSYSQSRLSKGKYVATPQEVHDSFDAVSTLRYSQPAHLSGKTEEALPPADLINIVL
jgi:cleavage and polyadenylation specificity factor subunit 2